MDGYKLLETDNIFHIIKNSTINGNNKNIKVNNCDNVISILFILISIVIILAYKFSVAEIYIDNIIIYFIINIYYITTCVHVVFVLTFYHTIE